MDRDHIASGVCDEQAMEWSRGGDKLWNLLAKANDLFVFMYALYVRAHMLCHRLRV